MPKTTSSKPVYWGALLYIGVDEGSGANIPGNCQPVPHPGRDRELLADDTPERAEADRRIVQAWERAHGTPDIKGAADASRARLLDMRPKDIR